jgi:uncharacterized repeat protein (TIGR04138 family)
MPLSSSLSAPRLRYHSDAYEFVFAALRYAQQSLSRVSADGPLDSEDAHITGPELLMGIRDLALEQFGLMARTVFASWGVTCTEDFGRIVFELVDVGRMRKTDRDQLSDFFEVFGFEEALDIAYRPNIDVSPRR